MADAPLAPLVPAAGLPAWARSQREAGHSIVFTNGCYDLLHPGHIRSLVEAARLGDVLLVAMNSDRSVRELKGEGRPVLDEASRSLMLRALRPVGALTIFDDSSVLPTILAARPHVLAKGAQYSEEDIVGATEVAGWGGRVARLPMEPGLSTTDLLRQIRHGAAGAGPHENPQEDP